MKNSNLRDENDKIVNSAGDELVTNDEQMVYYQPMSHLDVSPAMLNVSHTLDWRDNGKKLSCRARHIALERPLETQKEILVTCEFLSSPFAKLPLLFSQLKLLRNFQTLPSPKTRSINSAT